MVSGEEGWLYDSVGAGGFVCIDLRLREVREGRFPSLLRCIIAHVVY